MKDGRLQSERMSSRQVLAGNTTCVAGAPSAVVSRVRAALAAFALVVSCARDNTPTVGTVAGGVTPFDKLDGIHLGMSAREITRRRHATLFPYVGLSEQLGDARIEYGLNPQPDDSGTPYGRLESVTARSFFSDGETAERRASTTLETMIRAIGPLSCQRRILGGTEFIKARWRRMNQFVEVTLLHAGAEIGGTDPRYALLESVATDTIPRSGADTNLSPATCAASFHFNKGSA